MKYLKKLNEFAEEHKDALLVASGVVMLYAAYKWDRERVAWTSYANGLKVSGAELLTRDDGVQAIVVTLANGELIRLYKEIEAA